MSDFSLEALLAEARRELLMRHGHRPYKAICWTCQRPFFIPNDPGPGLHHHACSHACRIHGKELRIMDRLWARVRQDGECWLWQGKLSNHGYGLLSIKSKYVNVHRWLYQRVRGPLPAALTLDHLCRNPRCISPAHLEPVALRVNILRGQSPSALKASVTHCPYGHLYTPENTLGPPNRRTCRQCKLARDRRRYQRYRLTHPAPEKVPVTHCYRGHAYDVDNTYVDTKGKRRCRACKREVDAALRLAQRERER